MPVVIVAILQTLVYLSTVPICAAFSLSTRNGLRIGVGVSAFERRFALRRAEADGLPAKGRRRGRKVGRLLWRSAKRLRGARIRLQGRLDLGDAAATATACGALRAVVAALGSRVGRVEVNVVPLFAGDGLCVELTGMIRLRSGQIISVIAMNGIDSISRRLAKWTDIRLKA